MTYIFRDFRFPAAASVLSSVTCGCVKYLFSRKIYSLIFDSIKSDGESTSSLNSLFQWFIIYAICLKLMPHFPSDLVWLQKTYINFLQLFTHLQAFWVIQGESRLSFILEASEVCLVACIHLLLQQAALVNPVWVNNSVFNSFSSPCLT